MSHKLMVNLFVDHGDIELTSYILLSYSSGNQQVTGSLLPKV